jgi:pimeloyl-ACP methyl ester carboxylesterase
VVGHSGAGPYLFACGAALGPERLKFVGALGPWGPATVPEVVRSLNALDRFYSGLARRAPWTMRLFFAPLGWCARYLPGLFLLLLTSAVPPADRRALRDPRLRERLRAAEAEAFRQGGRGGAYEAGLAYRDWDVDLGSVRVPTHIWLGDRDIFVPRAMGRHLEREIPGADFHWVDGAGHFAVDTWDHIFAACAADLPGTPYSPHRPSA